MFVHKEIVKNTSPLMLRNASTIAKQLQLLHSLITSKHKYRQI